MDTRRYAKRQVTWFRGQMTDWTAVKPDIGVDDVVAMLPG